VTGDLPRSECDQSADEITIASMSEKRFHKPVVIQLGRIDRDRVVSSVVDASTILLKDWRHDDERRLHAMSAWLAVIRGGHPPPFAREAFVKAAEAAKVLLSD